MNIPYGELMKYRNHLPPIYQFPTFIHEYPIIASETSINMNIVDVGCGKSPVYNECLLARGHKGKYVGIDNDPALVTNFPLFRSVKEFTEQSKLREYDVLLALNFLEHVSLEEAYSSLRELNSYIDGKIILMTPNPNCFDYMFVDPQHKTFYSYEFLYGLLKHLGFNRVEIWRGKGLYQIREGEIKQNHPERERFKELNNSQRNICLAMGLDWCGNLLVVGERSDE